MKPIELIGISLYASDSDEIRKAIWQCIETSNEDLFAACAHSIGHMVRRFGVDVNDICDIVNINKLKFTHSTFVSGAIDDMESDIHRFSDIYRK